MFHLKAEFSPSRSQKKAISALVDGLIKKKRSQVLLGITGSGKTFTMANVIKNMKRQTLVIAHNKTLAAQLFGEFKAFFPENAVEYFVSYYDYYQPEAYIPRTDTYIEKDLSINDKIDRMRLSATKSLLERDDVIVVASVSCIYGLGSPDYYSEMVLELKKGERIRRDDVLLHLVEMHYERNDLELVRSSFRARGDILEIFCSYDDDIAYRVEFFGDEIERITKIDPLTGKTIERVSKLLIYPGSHHVTPEKIREMAILSIERELEMREREFEGENKLVERERIRERTRYDLEMIREIGFCKGIENYSRHFSKRKAGQPSSSLLDYFRDDFIVFVDESHQTIPQLHAMYRGDRARKKSLVDFGFRLPSAYDNRPLKFEEFRQRINQVVYVSATPGNWEIEEADGEVVQQIIRPTGLLDPLIEIKDVEGQVDDVLEEIRVEVGRGFRVLVTTLTKKLAEELSKYLQDIGVKAKYLHSSIDTLERIEIIKELRTGVFDVLVGINLLREGLDLPEVSLVAILDADKEGFLRSETSLIQTCGRASRNAEGRVILYAGKMTEAIKRTVEVTEKRRKLQEEHNRKYGIVPQTISKMRGLEDAFSEETKEKKETHISLENIEGKVKEYRREMRRAAKEERFEDAIHFRDLLKEFEDLELL